MLDASVVAWMSTLPERPLPILTLSGSGESSRRDRSKPLLPPVLPLPIPPVDPQTKRLTGGRTAWLALLPLRRGSPFSTLEVLWRIIRPRGSRCCGGGVLVGLAGDLLALAGNAPIGPSSFPRISLAFVELLGFGGVLLPDAGFPLLRYPPRSTIDIFCWLLDLVMDRIWLSNPTPTFVVCQTLTRKNQICLPLVLLSETVPSPPLYKTVSVMKSTHSL